MASITKTPRISIIIPIDAAVGTVEPPAYFDFMMSNALPISAAK
jgi:hypothetical protein